VGNPTTRLAWLNTTNTYISTTAQFDSYGNVVSSTDALGNRTTTTYDTTYHRFPVSITNALNQRATMGFDPVCGPSSATDANGQTSTTTFDPLCRPIRVDSPLGQFAATSFVGLGSPSTQYVETDGPSADGNGVQFARTYFDGLGRTYRKTSKGPSTSQTINADWSYDARGKIAS